MHKVIGNLEYIQGHLRYGHIELFLNAEQFEKFKSLSEEEQEEWLEDDGEIIVDDFEIEDRGLIEDIKF